MRSTVRIFTLAGYTSLLACESKIEADPQPPSEEEVLAVAEAWCEQPGYPCRVEDDDPPYDSANFQLCIDEVVMEYDRYAVVTECGNAFLDYYRCQTGMTCDEWGDLLQGRNHSCDDERAYLLGSNGPSGPYCDDD